MARLSTLEQEAGNAIGALMPSCAGVAPVRKKAPRKPASKPPECAPYWNEQCAAISSNLWLPSETVYANSASILFAPSSNGTESKSWFSTTRKQAPTKSSLAISCQLPQPAPTIEITKTRKIRLKLTAEQRRVFKSWFGCARFVYNRTVEYLRQPGTKASWMAISPGIIKALPEWCEATPYLVKAYAVKEACIAVKTAKKKYRDTGQISNVSFKTKRDPRQSVGVPGSAILPAGIYPTISGEGLRYCQPLPEKRVGPKNKSGKPTMADGRLLLENERWYLCVSQTITVQRPENQGRIVAVDPGIRTFATFYSPSECGQIALGAFARLARLAAHLDDLISRFDKKRKTDRVNAHRRYRMRKAAARMRAKFVDLVNELHWKTVRFLVDNFDVILLPTFETSQMVSRAKRKLRAKSVRSMLSLAHYKFAQRLEYKANSLGKTVLRVNEAYTSKTASWTGEVFPNLGGRKTIKSGGVRVNRDINGARGIFLRALGENPSLFNLESVQC